MGEVARTAICSIGINGGSKEGGEGTGERELYHNVPGRTPERGMA